MIDIQPRRGAETALRILRRGQPGRSGLTLVEMLVATTITLLMMAAVVQIFGMIGENVTNARAMLELNEQLRRASRLLHQDLQNAFAPLSLPLWGYENYEKPGYRAFFRITDAGQMEQMDTLSFTSRYGVFADGRAESPVEIEWKVETQGAIQVLRRTVRSVTSSSATPFQEVVLYDLIKFDVKVWNPATARYEDTSVDSDNWLQNCRSWLTANFQKMLDFDGLDNDDDGLVDEIDEFATFPPPDDYRGIQVTIRVREPDTQQEREVVIVHDFLPK
jgi:type II secretory pathway pseudopilin PulG